MQKVPYLCYAVCKAMSDTYVREDDYTHIILDEAVGKMKSSMLKRGYRQDFEIVASLVDTQGTKALVLFGLLGNAGELLTLEETVKATRTMALPDGKACHPDGPCE